MRSSLWMSLPVPAVHLALLRLLLLDPRHRLHRLRGRRQERKSGAQIPRRLNLNLLCSTCSPTRLSTPHVRRPITSVVPPQTTKTPRSRPNSAADAVVRETLFFVVVSTSGLVAGYQVCIVYAAPAAAMISPSRRLGFIADSSPSSSRSFPRKRSSSQRSRGAWMR